MENIKLFDFITVAIRRAWLLILAAVICATAAFCFCEFALTPVYTSTASIIVNNGALTDGSAANEKNSVAGTDITASLYLAETITDILKTPDIYKQLATEFEGDYTYSELKQAISVSRRSSESLFVDVQFKHTNPQEAMRVANEFVTLACEYISDFIPNSTALKAAEAVSASLIFPRTFAITGLAGILGLIITFIIVYIIDIRNDVVSSDEDFVFKYNIPLLGTVPDFEDVAKARKKRGFSHGKY